MIALAAEITSCAWLGLIALAALGTRSWRPRPAPASPWLRGEPPAVVSQLAGRLHRDGYPATLLDLAARGWFSMVEVEPGRVVCRVPARQADDGLTAYERRALAHVALRASGMDTVPGAALGSGFELGDQEFHTLFEGEVRDDASQRHLIRRRLGLSTLVLLATTGLLAASLAVRAALTRHGGTTLIPFIVVIYFAILRIPGAMYRSTRLTTAGRAALAEWLGFRAAVTGSLSRPTAGTALLAADGDRRIGYAAALGAAPAAVAAFSADGDRLWSSYGGSWRRVVVGPPHEPYVPGPGAQAGVTALCCLFACIVLVVLREFGWLWAELFALFPGCIWWGTAWWVFRCAARARRLPPLAEFDGQVLKRWTETTDADENTPSATIRCIAIDDGEREQAWSLIVSDQAYAGARAGMVMHVRVDPRRNRLLAMSPART